MTASVGLLRRQNMQLRQQNRELQRLVVTDALTRVGNRRHFDTALPAELQRAQRGRYQLALGLVDVDNFKAINDHFGHPTGDAVLHELAQRLKKVTRLGDMVFRYGGEEFAILFAPAGSQLQVKNLGERLLTAVRGSHIEPVGRVTVSVGLAIFDGSARGDCGATERWVLSRSVATELIQSADAALYEAKQTGRDKSCLK